MIKNNKLLDRARKLRKEMTPEERKLWYEFLRYHPIKIYKQRIVGNYIVDFYCHSRKLVIELDGSQHYTEEGLAYDKVRTQFLNGLGLKVIRFTNSEVKNQFLEVCQKIDDELKTAERTLIT